MNKYAFQALLNRSECIKENRFKSFLIIFQQTQKILDKEIARRNGKTKIPKFGVRTIYKMLDVTTLDEGFDEIFKVKIIRNGEFQITFII